MFVILLKLSHNKSQAGQFMEAHNHWISQGFDDGIFLLVGSLNLSQGGGIIAHNTTFDSLQKRVNDDPFVAENIVNAEIFEISPARVDENLKFLLEK